VSEKPKSGLADAEDVDEIGSTEKKADKISDRLGMDEEDEG